MNLDRKRRMIAVALLAFATWPLLHHRLVARYDLSPWRFFGWAMYCVPKLPVRTRIALDVESEGRRELTRGDLHAVALASELDRFNRRREAWGSLVSPAELGAGLLDAEPRARAVEIEVERPFLDPESAKIAARRQTYTYRRQAPDPTP